VEAILAEHKTKKRLTRENRANKYQTFTVSAICALKSSLE
jgi:hypothetical protein